MMDSIQTNRLTLRAPLASDAAMIAEGLSDFAVTKWLAQVPFPYDQSLADSWLARPENRWPELAMIVHNGQAIGCVDTKGGSIGYWLTRSAWGQGFMTEAASAMRDHYFKSTTEPFLKSGFFKDNAASQGVLTKLGFTPTGETQLFNLAQNKTLPHQNMGLTRTDWEASQ